MYGTQVPGSIAAGVPGGAVPLLFGMDPTSVVWAVLLAVTVVTAVGAGLRLLPRRLS